MNMRNIVSYLGSFWGVLSSITLFFPFANQVAGIIFVPTVNDDDGLLFATINSLICTFVLLASFSAQYLGGTFLPLFLCS